MTGSWTKTITVICILSFIVVTSLANEGFDDSGILFHLSAESVHPDHVLQDSESAIISFSVAGLGIAWNDVDWTLSSQGGAPIILDQTFGSIPVVAATIDRSTFLSIPIQTESLGSLPSRTQLTLTLDHASGAELYTFHVSLVNAEVLLISDGKVGVREVIGPVLESSGIVWGFAGVPMNQLTLDMFDAWTIMVEADARYSEYLFTDEDQGVRDWFSYGNGGSISGLYLHEIYPNAAPNWLGGLAGVWNDPIDETVFYGRPGDEIADGRTIEACFSDGVSICYPCCGNPANFHAEDGEAVAGWLDYGWRIVDYGFSLVHLENEDAIDMSRDELIQRTANWMLYRETSVDEPGDISIQPAAFELNTYPNPFNAFLTIAVNGSGAGLAPVQIINTNGQIVETLVAPNSNITQLSWDASRYPSGTYYVKTATPDGTAVRKVTLLK
jgi:hypothetical protein